MPLPLLLAAPAIIKGVSSLASYAAARRNQPELFSRTAAGRRALQVSKEGAFSASERRGSVAEAIGPAAQEASRQQTRLSGRLAATGNEGSIAGLRAQNEISAGVGRLGSEAARSFALQNEASKRAAADQFAAGQTASVEARRQAKLQATQSLIGGLGGAGASLAGAAAGFTTNPGAQQAFSLAKQGRQEARLGRIEAGTDFASRLQGFGQQLGAFGQQAGGRLQAFGQQFGGQAGSFFDQFRRQSTPQAQNKFVFTPPNRRLTSSPIV